MADEPVVLPALEGTNPLGFLAALGVLDALDRAGRRARLSWTDELVPVARVSGAADVDDLVALLDRDRLGQEHQQFLGWSADGRRPMDDLKPSIEHLRAWVACVDDLDETGFSRRFTALMAEGGVDLKGATKPTHLHFTAGQQKFLVMVRALRDGVTADALREAVTGPWRYEARLPSLSWDNRGERIYALRATDPAGDARGGVPGANWLAWVGLSMGFVVRDTRGVRTAACDRAWKSSAMRWVLWADPLPSSVVRSLLADPTLVGQGRPAIPTHILEGRGILRVLQSPIRRTDQGGYGSFGPASLLGESRA